MVYVIWQTEGTIYEGYDYIGIARTKKQAKLMVRKAIKALKDANMDEPDSGWSEKEFEIEKTTFGHIWKECWD